MLAHKGRTTIKYYYKGDLYWVCWESHFNLNKLPAKTGYASLIGTYLLLLSEILPEVSGPIVACAHSLRKMF